MNAMDIYNKLKAHFSEEDIEFKVGATNKEKTQGLALAYVNARAVQERLDTVLGFNNWKAVYKEVQGGFICALSLRVDGEWITKEDGAQATAYESIKGGMSSAFKRVASSGFGIGRYLYTNEASWYPIRPLGKGYEFTINPTLSLRETKHSESPTKTQSKTQAPLATSDTPQEVEEEIKKVKLKKMTLEKAANLKWPMGKIKGTALGIVYKNSPEQIKYFYEHAYEGKFEDIKDAINLLDDASPEKKKWKARVS